MKTTKAMPGYLRATVDFNAAAGMLMLIFLVFGHSSEAADPAHAARAQGQLVDVGTHRLHIYCEGQGSPTVIIDSGLGEISLEWRHIQKSLSHYSRVCLYDRAGYGWSDAGPLPRTSSIIADELHRLLTTARIAGPYVLVGHSFGGYNMQVFAGRYADLTAGVVLVDSSHPQQYERFRARPINVKTAPDNFNGKRNFRFSVPRLHPKVPGEVRDDVMAMLLRRPMQLAMANEFYDYRQSAIDVLETGELPPVPLLVLSRGMRVYPHDRRGDLMEILWSTLQAELALLSPRSAHLVARESGHFIHLDQPQLVVESVALIIDIVKFNTLADPVARADLRQHRPSWYAFNDTTWRSDWLRTIRAPGPLFPSQNGHRQPGFMADPFKSSWHGEKWEGGLYSN